MRPTEPQSPVIPWTYDLGPESIGIAESILIEEAKLCSEWPNEGRTRKPKCGAAKRAELRLDHTGKNPAAFMGGGQRNPCNIPQSGPANQNPCGSCGLRERQSRAVSVGATLQGIPAFAEVAYFPFLALHRIGRTIDALGTARKFLAGDKVYAYSNLLGTLSAVISREHYDTDPNLYPLLLDALAGGEETRLQTVRRSTLLGLNFLIVPRLRADFP